MNTFG